MKDRVVFFTADRGFILPTMAAALQIDGDENLRNLVDIIVFLVDFDESEVINISEIYADTILSFRRVLSIEFLPPEGSVFNKTHVPLSTLARLSVADSIPKNYEHVIYLDGDIRIVGDITPLLKYSVEPGRILAACDAMILFDGDWSPYWSRSQSYLSGIGISDPRDYFNAGVLACRRETWIEIANQAKEYFFENSERCLYHDQSALNAVCKGRRDVMSPTFNFITNFASLGVISVESLAIVHFTGAAKPWFYPGPPWNGLYIRDYRRFIQEQKVLEIYEIRKNNLEIAIIDEEVRSMRRKSAILKPWAMSMRRRRFLEYFKKTSFVI